MQTIHFIRKTRALLLSILLLASVSAAESPAKAVPQRRVTVLPLTNLRKDAASDWIGRLACETLNTQLNNIPGIILIERHQMEKLAEESDFSLENVDELDTAKKLGQMLSADRLLLGTFVLNQKQVLFNVRMVDVRSGLVLSTATVRGREDEIFDVIFKLTSAVIESFEKKVVVVNEKPSVVPSAPGEQIHLTAEQKQQMKSWGTTNPQAADALVKSFDAKTGKEQLDWATRAVTLDPKYLWGYQRRGMILLDAKQPKKAIPDFSTMIRLDPSNALGYHLRGRAYGEAGEYQNALPDFEKAVQLNPQFTSAISSQAAALYMLGEWEKAKELYSRALHQDPNDPISWVSRGRCELELKDFQNALRDFSQAIHLNPQNSWSYYYRGKMRIENLNDAQTGMQDLTEAIRLNPKIAIYYYDRARGYEAFGQFSEAEADCKTALRLQENYVYWGELGQIYFQTKQYKKAAEMMDKAIKIQPKYKFGRIGRGISLYELKEYTKAIQDFDVVLELVSDQSSSTTWRELMLYRIRAYCHLGEYEKARNDVNIFKEKDIEIPQDILEAIQKK